MDRVPIRNDDLLWLEGDSFDLQALLAATAPLGLKPMLGSKFSLIELELKKLLLERGVSYVWQLVRLTEAVMPPGVATRPTLLKVLEAMLVRLSASTSLTIVDPYLFHDGAAAELGDLLSVIGTTTPTISLLRLVTKPLRQSTMVGDLRLALASTAPQCQVHHVSTNRYHDRFWIVDETKGLFVGTSLNGIGKKYSIVDYLDSHDVADIVSDLMAQKLL
jgi:hypothetical protein